MSQLLISLICLIFSTHLQAQTILDQSLLSDSFSNVMITLNPSVQRIINQIEQQEFPSQQAKRLTLIKNMRGMTQAAQAPLLSILQDFKPLDMSINPFWITNGIIVRNFPLPLLQLIVTLSSLLNIAKIERELEFPVLPTFDSTPVPASSIQVAPPMPWGIKEVRAPELWKQNILGQDCIVGVIDTGVRQTHESLLGNIKVESCFDPTTGLTAVPDFNGHGTHVTGTVCGNNGIGVAPNATVIMCKGCGTSACTQNDLTTCCQYMLCTKPTCDAPQIVSNSWGGGNNNPFWDDALSAWVSGGILPVFAIGNSGPNCATANSPGDRPNCLGVGATSSNKNITSFSSKGPAEGRTKPNIAAPGAAILSADFAANNLYKSLSGTSMACPHVAGCAALLVSAHPGISPSQLATALLGSTNKGVVTSSAKCGDIPANQFPNNWYGYGFVDVLKAHDLASQLMSK